MKNSLIMIVSLSMLFSSCEKEIEQGSMDFNKPLAGYVEDSVNLKSTRSPYLQYNSVPQFGKPNQTQYEFKVYDLAGLRSMSVKLYDKATNQTTYHAMVRIGNYWRLTKTIASSGWYNFRYVFSNDSSAVNANTPTLLLCNTKNVFDVNGVSSISWPFEPSISSFTNRNSWIGSRESGGCGQKWWTDYTTSQQATIGHKYYSCGADDSYAEDWNKGCSTPNADLGKYFASPLDGKVIKVTVDAATNHWGGYGNSVDIEQKASNGDVYVFRIAHLQYPPLVSVGQWVRANSTLLGQIGMSGGTSTAPHAHMVLYKVNGCYSPVKFAINAN